MYRLDVGGVQELFAFLVGDCCGGQPELCGPFLGPSNCAPKPSVGSSGKKQAAKKRTR
jgi:hypothetical protein